MEVTETMKAHVALNVTDLRKSLDFYQRMLGIPPLKIKPGYAKFDVQDPPLNLSLNAGAEVSRRGTLSHLGLQVAGTDDVLAIRKRWADAGLNPRDEMQASCCYALQDKSWVTDPDGNEWEVFTVLADIEQQAGNACCNRQQDLVSITSSGN